MKALFFPILSCGIGGEEVVGRVRLHIHYGILSTLYFNLESLPPGGNGTSGNSKQK